MPITKQHFEDAAQLVEAILRGDWTHESPSWAIPWNGTLEIESSTQGNLNTDYIRAVWTAEAFVIFFSQWNPRFDRERFLKACGF
jgi:hypothetical protein